MGLGNIPPPIGIIPEQQQGNGEAGVGIADIDEMGEGYCKHMITSFCWGERKMSWYSFDVLW
jgi:hypothetical protein